MRQPLAQAGRWFAFPRPPIPRAGAQKVRAGLGRRRSDGARRRKCTVAVSEEVQKVHETVEEEHLLGHCERLGHFDKAWLVCHHLEGRLRRCHFIGRLIGDEC